MLPIDRTAKSTLDTNLANGNTSDAPAVKASNDVVYNTIDEVFNYVSGVYNTDKFTQLGIINVKDSAYKASGSVQTTTGSITTGTAILTVASIIDFAVGQGISVAGAGAAGAALITKINSISGTTLTLAANASATVTNQTVSHDETAAFNSISAAVNASTYPLTVIFPLGNYNYFDGFNFTKPVKLFGYGATLNYTGTGKAVKIGPDGLTSSTFDKEEYIVEGLRFTGGANMTHGIYFNKFLTMPRVINCHFYNFGNATAYAVWFQSNNWDSFILGCSWYADGAVARNFIRVNNDSINSTRLRVLGMLGSNQSTVRGIGIWLDGANNEVAHCKLEGFSPNVRLGGLATNCRISDTYFETNDNSGCVQYGAPTGDIYVGNFTDGLVIQNCFANTHNTDQATTSYFLQPTTTQSALQNTRLDGVFVTGSNRELVQQNNLASQTNNQANECRGTTAIHTTGASVTPWGGTNGQFYAENLIDETTYHTFKAGKTAKQYHGIRLINFDGTDALYLEAASNGFTNIKNGTKTVCQFDSSGNFIVGGSISGVQSSTSPSIASGATISTNGMTVSRVSPGAAVTGVILQAGLYAGQEITVINEAIGANSVTFAAASSNVADGSSDVIAGVTARKFVWNSVTALWYRTQ